MSRSAPPSAVHREISRSLVDYLSRTPLALASHVISRPRSREMVENLDHRRARIRTARRRRRSARRENLWKTAGRP